MSENYLEKKEAIEKLISLTDEVKICMFTTIHDDYSIISRPMQTIKADNEGNLWFFTNEFSGKVDDISKENTVYLMYSHPGKNTYIQVKGKCTVVTDKNKMQKYWSPIVKAWFPQGLEDPALALLKVEPIEANYWDSSSNKLVVFYNIIKAIVQGKEADEGEQGNLVLNKV